MDKPLGEELAKRSSKQAQTGKKVVARNLNSKNSLERRAAKGIDLLALKILRARQMGASASQLRFPQKNLGELLFIIGSNAAEPKTRGKLVVSNELLQGISNSNRLAQKELSRLFGQKLAAKLRQKPKRGEEKNEPIVA